MKTTEGVINVAFIKKEDEDILKELENKDDGKPDTVEEKTWLDYAIKAVAITLTLFHLYTAFAGSFQSLIQRSIHVCVGIVLLMLLDINKNKTKTARHVINWTMIAVSLVSCVYIVTNFNAIMAPSFDINLIEEIIAIAFIIVVLISARRSLGIAIPLLSLIGIVYALFGKYFPGIWYHNGISLDNLLTILFYTDRGVWGSITGVSATIIATFIIFGTILFATGGGQTFINLANALTGRSYGGAAKLATVASGLFGTISGSAGANVATTGAFTIPLMKRLGYGEEFAGAVEAAASSGGQIMPPIMGAGAFIMADLLGMPYLGIALAAVIPAFMFYYGVFLSIDLAARKYGFKGLPEDEVVPLKEVLYYKSFLPIFVPIALLIVFFLKGYTAVTCASYAILSAIILYLAMDIKDFPNRFKVLVSALEDAAKDMLTVLTLISCAQILVCLISVTGIGVKFTNIIMVIGKNNIILAGILAMIATMILGMGMPTVAAYVLAASVIAPALVRVGVAPIAAHFFVFYYAIFAGLTPPVCGTIFIASAIAKSNWLKTAWISMRISVGAFIVPFMFLFSPALLLVGSSAEIIRTSITCLIGMTALAAGGMGYLIRPLSMPISIVLMLSGVMLVDPQVITDVIGIGVFVLILLWLLITNKKAKAVGGTINN
jgi:TRAP transporter 4TM/12TM fusion protein